MGRKQSIDGAQRYWYRQPGPDLAGLVSGIHGYAESDEMRGVVEPAALDVPLIINFGGSFRIGLGRSPTPADRQVSFAAGLHLGPVMMDSDGEAQCIQVNFTPLGARRFFGIPMHELADRMVPLADLGDRAIDRVADRLSALNSWEARLELAEAFLRERLRRSPPVDPALDWAFSRLSASQGRARIGVISDRLEWSRRRLVARFRHDLGLPPKAVARIIRFNAAQAMAGDAARPDWADVAAACGYADQAHLTREFRELAGRSPGAWHAAA